MIDMGLLDPEWPLPARGEEIPAWESIENKDEWDLKMAVYAAMIDRMDRNIGRILDKLEQLGKLDNTLILFLSDNGGCAETVHVTPDVPPGQVNSYRSVDPPWANASNTPFRKYKAWNLEGGTCTPFIARWPGVIAPGSITHQVGHIMDILATVIDLCGAKYPQYYGRETVFPMEGRSLAPVFRGEQRKGHDALFWRVGPGRGRAVRQGRWKLVAKDGKNQWELYDMANDRMETKNLAGLHPEKVKEMAELYINWEIRVGITNR
ncbi:sulfatase-like hydrolase/transferase [candidate division KSB1 bacterium]|nr:sulfatase-like hydrolase/transferase [candidate division KSB1 bacterium]